MASIPIDGDSGNGACEYLLVDSFPTPRAAIERMNENGAPVEDVNTGKRDDFPSPRAAIERMNENVAPVEDVNTGKREVLNNEQVVKGFKARPQIVKKGGKKLLTKRRNTKGKSLLQFGSKAEDRPRTVKYFRRTGPSYNFNSKDRDVQALLNKYEAVREQYRRAGKREMAAFHDFRHDYWNLLCNGQESIVGSVPGIDVGMCFSGRTQMFLVALHCKLQAGIDWIPADKSPVLENNEPVSVAVSVVVTGRFEDDVDEGHRILYCGEGGRPYVGAERGQQTAHQELTKGNLALHNSARLGRSVRVIRKHRDECASSGICYSYDGMYRVSRSYPRWVRGGYRVYMFELNRVSNQVALKW